MKGSTAAVSLVMVTGVCGLGTGPATADTAVSAEPTVVRLLGGGVLQVVTPDDQNVVEVADILVPNEFSVTDFFHPLVAVAPCELKQTSDGDLVVCPANQVSSILVLTGAGDDQVQTATTVPVVVLTGDGNDQAIDNFSQEAHFFTGTGNDRVVPAPSFPTS